MSANKSFVKISGQELNNLIKELGIFKLHQFNILPLFYYWELVGTDFYFVVFDNGATRVAEYQWRDGKGLPSDDPKLRSSDIRVSFEEVLSRVNGLVYSSLLFHIDIFNHPHW